MSQQTLDPFASLPAKTIFVDYSVVGERSAAAVLRNHSYVTALTVADRQGCVQQFTANFADALAGYGSAHRVYHDAIFARAVEDRHWIPPPPTFDDLRIVMHLLDENRSCEFDDLDKSWHCELGEPAQSQPTATNAGQGTQPVELFRQFMEHVRPLDQLVDQGLDFVYREIELPLVAPVAAMHCLGLPVDLSQLRDLGLAFWDRVDAAQRAVDETAGRHVNVGSYSDLASYLFDELGLPVLRWTADGNPAVDDESLQAIDRHHPVVRAIRSYRADKVISDAASALEAAQPCRDWEGLLVEDRLICHLDPQGTTTGRFSCCKPNLQALPPELLPVIVAHSGYQLLEADFSQIELRVLAEVSQDATLRAAFEIGADIHARTAAKIYGISEDAVSREQRRVGKAVNFGIIYGQTQAGLAGQLRISEPEAAAAIEGFFTAFPGVRPWIRQTEESAAVNGYVLTHYCRRRRVPGLGGSRASRSTLRQAVNAVIQGTAADILKMAIARFHQEMPPECSPVLTVHDSLLVETPACLAPMVERELKRIMEMAPPDFSVPLEVNIRAGRTWAECKNIESEEGFDGLAGARQRPTPAREPAEIGSR